jgi:DNA-binding GntR family transcriptional regulator
VIISSLSGSTLIFVTVDHGAPEPAYQQLSGILRAKIVEGEWRTGPLPSVKQLQQEYGVGRDTVLRAIEVLRMEGLVFTVPRRGSYVSPDAK